MSVIPGAISAAEVADNVASLTTSVPADLWTDLKSRGLLPAGSPVP
jgi:D-threo-aldose 1-dehydrogenase